MILYISFVGAWALKNVTSAMESQTKTQKRILVELTVITSLITIVYTFVLALVNSLIPPLLDLPRFIVSSWFGIVNSIAFMIIELILSLFVLIKLHFRSRYAENSRSKDKSRYAENSRSKAKTEDDFKKLVALVALAFSCSHIIVLLDFVFALDCRDRLEATQSRWRYGSYLIGVMTSSINLGIYLIASNNFRFAFRSYCGNVKKAIICR